MPKNSLHEQLISQLNGALQSDFSPIFVREEIRYLAQRVLESEPLIPRRVFEKEVNTLTRAERRINRVINN